MQWALLAKDVGGSTADYDASESRDRKALRKG